MKLACDNPACQWHISNNAQRDFTGDSLGSVTVHAIFDSQPVWQGPARLGEIGVDTVAHTEVSIMTKFYRVRGPCGDVILCHSCSQVAVLLSEAGVKLQTGGH